MKNVTTVNQEQQLTAHGTRSTDTAKTNGVAGPINPPLHANPGHTFPVDDTNTKTGRSRFQTQIDLCKAVFQVPITVIALSPQGRLVDVVVYSDHPAR